MAQLPRPKVADLGASKFIPVILPDILPDVQPLLEHCIPTAGA